MSTGSEQSEGRVSMDVEIVDGRTEITVTGERDASVVVRSASGERVYLPPERTEGEGGPSRPVGDGESHYEGQAETSPYEGPSEDSPYDGPTGESPYEGVPDDSPYDAAKESPSEAELTPTGNGFRIFHPEPVTDIRFLR